MLNGQLVSLPEDVYDSFIFREIEAEPEVFREAEVIGRVLGKYQLGLGTDGSPPALGMIRAGMLEPVTQPEQGIPTGGSCESALAPAAHRNKTAEVYPPRFYSMSLQTGPWCSPSGVPLIVALDLVFQKLQGGKHLLGFGLQKIPLFYEKLFAGLLGTIPRWYRETYSISASTWTPARRIHLMKDTVAVLLRIIPEAGLVAGHTGISPPAHSTAGCRRRCHIVYSLRLWS